MQPTQPDLQHHTPPPPDDFVVQETCAIVAQMAKTYNWTHNVTVEEAPGYLPLGTLLVYFGNMLSHTMGGTYKCHPQRTVAKNTNPGQNPSTDIALILKERNVASPHYISRVLYEYKPRIHQRILLINMKNLLELFLQCYYVMKYEKTPRIIGCLTDLVNWHFFKLQLSVAGRLEVVQYTMLVTTLSPKETDILQHLAILLAYLK